MLNRPGDPQSADKLAPNPQGDVSPGLVIGTEPRIPTQIARRLFVRPIMEIMKSVKRRIQGGVGLKLLLYEAQDPLVNLNHKSLE